MIMGTGAKPFPQKQTSMNAVPVFAQTVPQDGFPGFIPIAEPFR
jgi:hypothetical protein